MDFTYNSYATMLSELKKNGYVFTDYNNSDVHERCVILRHDIDTSLDKAVELAKLEAQQRVSSTYFVLLSSEFYNVIARDSRKKIKEIQNMGHDIGLHFDELNYEKNLKGGVQKLVVDEARILQEILQIEIKSVSMHRPSKETLEANYDLSPIINSYGKRFFKEFKYVSDSRRRWREDVTEIIQSGKYDKLHILTHAFWYHDKEKDLKTTIKEFVNQGNIDRYHTLDKNITDLKSILGDEEI